MYNIILLLIILVNITKANKHENNMILERIEYKMFEEGIFSYYNIELKPIAHNVYRINATAILLRRCDTMWAHIILYYRYATYQKFLIDLWEDVCGFLDGVVTGPLTKIGMDNLKTLDVELNFPKKCPLRPGQLSIVHRSLNYSNVVIPLLPAGRYRLDIFMSAKRNGSIQGQTQTYFSISDFRVWF